MILFKHLGTFSVDQAAPVELDPGDYSQQLVTERPVLKIRARNDGTETVSLVTFADAGSAPTAPGGLSTMTIAPGATEEFTLSAIHHRFGFIQTLTGGPEPNVVVVYDLFIGDAGPIGVRVPCRKGG